MLWGVIFWAAIAYIAVSPDKTSLAASRGFWGAARGFAKPGRTSSENGRPGASKGPRARWAGLLDGWRDGVRVARQQRANGKDLWSRGTYVAGRVYGGAGSIRAGVRRLKLDLGIWRANRAARKGGPTVEGFVVDEQPTTEQSRAEPNDEARHAPTDEPAARRQGPQEPMGDGPVYGPQPYTGPDNGFRHHIADPADNDRAYCGVDHPAPPFTVLVSLIGHEGCDACCPLCRRRAAEQANSGRHVVQGEVIAIAPTKDLAADQAAEGAPAEGAGAPSITTIKPAMAGEENTMSINTTELESLDAVAAEVERAQQMCAALAETLEATKAWAQGLIDRWSGTNWGTDELDTGVAEAADAVSTLGDTEPLDVALRSISTAVHNARSLAEVADEVGAKGSIDAFRAS